MMKSHFKKPVNKLLKKSIKKRTKRKNPEGAIQRELVKWLRLTYPLIEIRYNKNENKANKVQAIVDKKLGQAIAGTPDLTLFCNKRGYTYILELELKTKTGKLSPSQKLWHSKFISTANRKAVIAYGFVEAITAVERWLGEISENS